MSSLSDQRLGRYHLEERIGRGGMAEVYRARDDLLDRLVAVKVILPAFAAEAQFLERFLQEARLVAQLDHPNVLPIFDFGEENGLPYLVMPMMSGGPLSKRLDGPRPLPEVIAWSAQLGAALDHAHQHSVLHRDVKPANVLFARHDRLVLGDFGIARLFEGTTRLTATGAVVGTPSYMAPEVARGKAATPASDRYALGVMVWEMLAGAPPFEGENALSILHQHLHEPVPELASRAPGLPADTDQVLARILAKEPEARPGTATEIAELLLGLLSPDEREQLQSGLLAGSVVTPAGGSQRVTPGGTVVLGSAPAAAEAPGGEETPLLGSPLPPSSPAPPELPPLRSRRLPLVAAVALVLFGVVAGIVAFQLLTRPPAPQGPAQPSAAAATRLSTVTEQTPPAPDVDPPPTRPATAERSPAPTSSADPEAAPEPPPRPAPPESAAKAPISQAGGRPVAEPGGRSDFVRPALRDQISLLNWPRSRLDRELLQRLGDALAPAIERAPAESRLAILGRYVVGGERYLAGDDGAARGVLEELRPHAAELVPWMRAALRSGEPGELEEWEVAWAYADARAEGEAAVTEHLRRYPDDRRAEVARAFFVHLRGAHREAAEIAKDVHGKPEVADSSLGWYLEQIVCLEKLEDRQWEGGLEWYVRALSHPLPPIGSAALYRQATALARDLGASAEVLQRLRQEACEAGTPGACGPMAKQGARRGRGGGTDRPR